MPDPTLFREHPDYVGDERAVDLVLDDLFPAEILRPAFEGCLAGAPTEYHEAILNLRENNFRHRTEIFISNLGLNTVRPRRVIDVGTGMAHFPRLCEYFGHDTLCTSLESEDSRDYYVCVRRRLGYPDPVDLEVRAMEPLPGELRDLDDWIFLSPTFNMQHGERHWDTSRFWPIEPWLFLFRDLATRLRPGGRVYFYAVRCAAEHLGILRRECSGLFDFLKAKPWDGEKDFGEILLRAK
ncbi:hypothetical protein [Desulfovibrio aminophilus]|jgi:hypothetical protein|uniref:hypothetical protein n=1 Tax=Desulfovibrio aminophilus TaxID=81425 RepID=UPI00041B60EA|nr:hypothetical protein [Desulfovibrio aminophilus]